MRVAGIWDVVVVFGFRVVVLLMFLLLVLFVCFRCFGGFGKECAGG